jgi:hypothetical protein
VLWGSSFFFVGIAIKELPTFTVVLTRVGLAALFLQIAMQIETKLVTSISQPWGAFFTMAFLNNVIPFSFIVWGQRIWPRASLPF